jgi:hypothetical protein
MAASMAAMMLPTAVPFLVSLRRPTVITEAAAVYAAVWAAIGVGAWLVMSAVMLPSASWVAWAAIGFGVAYSLTPWARRGAERCQEMCREAIGEPAWKSGLTYAGNCVLCSAGVMAALLVVGMSNLAWMAAASAVILIYKGTRKGQRSSSRWPASRSA